MPASAFQRRVIVAGMGEELAVFRPERGSDRQCAKDGEAGKERLHGAIEHLADEAAEQRAAGC